MTLAPMGASLLTQAWIGRELGRVGLGEYHAVGLFVTVLTTLLFLGFPAAAAQRISVEDEAHAEAIATRTAFSIALGFALAIGLAALVLSGPFVRVFEFERDPTPWLLAASASAAALAGFAAHVALARLEVGAATLIIAAQPVAVALAIAGSAFGRRPDGPSLAAVGFIATGIVGGWILLRRGILPGLFRTEAVALLSRTLPAVRLTYPSLITTWVDRGLVGILLGPSALGAFVAASTLVDALQRIARGIGSIGVPTYARLTGDSVGARRVLDSHIRLVAALFVLAGAAFIASGPAMLTILFGEGFVIATTTLRLLSFAAVPLGIAAVLASQGVGADVRYSARVLGVLGLMHVVVTTVGTLMFHIAGTALANVIVWTIGAILYARQAARRGAPVQTRTLMRIAGVTVPVFVFAWFLGLQPLPWPLRAGLASALAALPVFGILLGDPEWRLLRLLAPGSRARRVPEGEP